jgi:hypothetical protein
MCVAFLAPVTNKLWRVAEWLVRKRTLVPKVVAAARVVEVEAVAVQAVEVAAWAAVDLPGARVAVAADAPVVAEVAKEVAVVVAVPVVVVADKVAVDKVVAVGAVARVAAAVVRVAVDKAVVVVVVPVVAVAKVVEAAAVLVAEVVKVVADRVAAAVPVVGAAAENPSFFRSNGAPTSGAPFFSDPFISGREPNPACVTLVGAVDTSSADHLPSAASFALARRRERHPSGKSSARHGDRSRAQRSPQHCALCELDSFDDLSTARAGRRR